MNELIDMEHFLPLKANYIPAVSGELKATTLIIEDPFTGVTLNVKDTLALKQNILIAGDNITITNDTISSTGRITHENLDLKQDIVNDFLTNSIKSYSAEFLN